MDYLVCGAFTPYNGGGRDIKIMGGSAIYALSGIRLWIPHCKPVATAGEDFDAVYGAWFTRHAIVTDAVCFVAGGCAAQSRQKAEAYGVDANAQLRPDTLCPTARAIDNAATFDTRGVYIAAEMDAAFWREVYDSKCRKGYKVMWEYVQSIPFARQAAIEALPVILSYVDMWSVNLAEAARLFDVPQKEIGEIIARLQAFPVELTLLRLGAKGSYAITQTQAVLCESIDHEKTVDASGCGSTACGAALYAQCEGYAPAMVAAMANTAAGYAAAQAGPYAHITPSVTQAARETADLYYRKATGRL